MTIAFVFLEQTTLTPDVLFTVFSSHPPFLQNCPIIFLVILVVKPLKEIFEQLPQILVVRSLVEAQALAVVQVEEELNGEAPAQQWIAQLFCISDIYLLMLCQLKNTKDMAGQSATCTAPPQRLTSSSLQSRPASPCSSLPSFPAMEVSPC